MCKFTNPQCLKGPLKQEDTKVSLKSYSFPYVASECFKQWEIEHSCTNNTGLFTQPSLPHDQNGFND